MEEGGTGYRVLMALHCTIGFPNVEVWIGVGV